MKDDKHDPTESIEWTVIDISDQWQYQRPLLSEDKAYEIHKANMLRLTYMAHYCDYCMQFHMDLHWNLRTGNLDWRDIDWEILFELTEPKFAARDRTFER